MFNSGSSDFCGNQAPSTKLAKHFSKNLNLSDYSSCSQPGDVSAVQTSFQMKDLIGNVIFQQDQTLKPLISDSPSLNDSVSQRKYESNNNNFNNLYPIYNIPTNTPTSQLQRPNTVDVAKVWAHSELSQYDNNVISENELKNMIEKSKNESKLRFSDVIRNIALNEEDLEEGESDFDRNIRNMRDKLIPNHDSDEIWQRIDASLKQAFDVMGKNYDLKTDLDFVVNNHFITKLNDSEHSSDSIKNIFDRGVELYNNGYFSEASLAFESVVQSYNEDMKAEAWSYLGLSYSENEQDDKALIACQRSLEMRPNDRQVLLSIARIYCNEMSTESTVKYLEKWLLAHPKYRNLATVGQEATAEQTNNWFESGLFDDVYGDTIFMSSGKYQIIEQQFQLASEQNGAEVDAELEIARGTLYHSVQDYDNSALHFEKAATKIGNEPQLWNKLGTAYCNQGNFDKSINAYNKALELAPGFSRAECNLGVAYYNMSDFESAIRHALRAHKLQHTSTISDQTADNIILSDTPTSNFDSDPIWTLIRLSSFKLNRPELDLVIFSKDADTLMKEFGV